MAGFRGEDGRGERMKRIVGVTYENGACVGITVDGILDNDTNPNELVNFERVRHGYWIAHPHRKHEEYIQGYGYEVCEWDNYSCNYCGKQSPGNSKYNYCPNCGAKMDVITSRGQRVNMAYIDDWSEDILNEVSE